ncbi:nucleotidyl transferase AbiEii/AbiGii toxin family protein [Telmatocola sphagniphila]|uniref:Nucleotidyl transferase AbiEii/AbiGii toxin family protein n=1 Tax=Telmatocola sphagniphila TaxID=1123043 RepID=A0A8E6B3C9_9BACT|nr:nucleotidyl transferase AbiEii/AbiGii toxin family protein [Telmatocola sphagniphila]QVL31107.1 nucleotidyl transferase AbiEii/AbiGii toxin family protein [Telmatocola sphagniphila]
MNRKDSAHWKSQVLDEIFVALAASKQLDEVLVFKGARVLNVRLGFGRQSLDLDTNLTASFVQNYPCRDAQQRFLEEEIATAVRRHFERQAPVRFELTELTVRTYPSNSHPIGWDAFKVKLNVNDLARSIRGLPALEIDVAAPEQMLDSSVSPVEVGGHFVFAYTLERIAGEKLRAFLSSLPAYRSKVKKPGEAVRAKDLYDLSRIRRVHGLEQVDFWKLAGEEFRIACRSRYIDCQGLTTFQEQFEVTRKTYEEATIPKDIAFAEAESTLVAVVSFWEAQRIVPFTFPLPEGPAG